MEPSSCAHCELLSADVKYLACHPHSLPSFEDAVAFYAGIRSANSLIPSIRRGLRMSELRYKLLKAFSLRAIYCTD